MASLTVNEQALTAHQWAILDTEYHRYARYGYSAIRPILCYRTSPADGSEGESYDILQLDAMVSLGLIERRSYGPATYGHVDYFITPRALVLIMLRYGYTIDTVPSTLRALVA